MNKDTINLINHSASTFLNIAQMTQHRTKYLQNKGSRGRGNDEYWGSSWDDASCCERWVREVMKTIDIANILTPDLKFRMRAQDLKLMIENSGADAVEMDFQGVKFATRSFIDEFYNLFLKTPEANTFSVELINVPSDIKAMLDAVSRTQVRANVIPSQSQEVSFKNVKEFLNYFSTLVL